MALLDTGENIKFTLTKTGIKKGFEEGFKKHFKFITLSDDNVYYPSDVMPDKFPDITGCHQEVTYISNYCKNKISS